MSIQEIQPEIEDATGEKPRVYASVNGFEIGEREVLFLMQELRPVSESQRKLLHSLTAEKLDSAASHSKKMLEKLRAAVVQQWIERLVVLSYLRSKEEDVGESQVTAEISRQDEELREQGESLESYLQQLEIDSAVYRTHLAWKLSWEKYVEQRITQEALEKYYQIRRRQFDGTQLRVCHIVRTFSVVSTVEEKKSIVDEMERLKQRINSGGITFQEAAIEYSEGTTAEKGGQLGWIDYAGPQSSAFNRVAFKTPIGHVSDLAETETSVHLIRVLEEKPGTIPFSERIDQVRVSMVADLWKWILDQQKDQVSIVRS